MHLIDGHRLAARIAAFPVCQIGVIGPGEIIRAGHLGGCLRPHLGGKAQGIALQRQALSGGVQQLVFVALALRSAGNEDFPHARVAAFPHHMAAAVPAVEVAHHGHPGGVGGPHGEMHARVAFMAHRVGAQPVMQAKMVALTDIVVVERPQHGAQQIGILHRPFA